MDMGGPPLRSVQALDNHVGPSARNPRDTPNSSQSTHLTRTTALLGIETVAQYSLASHIHGTLQRIT